MKQTILRDEKGRFVRIKPNRFCITCNKVISRYGESESCIECANNRNSINFAKVIISQEAEQILLGTILGDGCLMPNTYNKKTARLIEGHSIDQKEYLEWKSLKLDLPSSLCENKQKKIITFRKNGFYVGYKKSDELIDFIWYRSKFLPQLYYYRDLFYPNGKKIVTKEILEKLTPLAIAVWYMDDGSYNYSGKASAIATDSFSLKEVELIKDWFFEKFEILFTIRKKEKGFYIYTRSRRFIDLISEHILPMFQYKLGLDPIRISNARKSNNKYHAKWFRERKEKLS